MISVYNLIHVACRNDGFDAISEGYGNGSNQLNSRTCSYWSVQTYHNGRGLRMVNSEIYKSLIISNLYQNHIIPISAIW